MDQSLGKNPPSGTEEEKGKKRKKSRSKSNGKSNGKTNWKGLAQELSKQVESLKSKNEFLHSKLEEVLGQIEKAEAELEDSNRLLQSMRDEVKECRRSSMGEREKVVLRNLRYFHGRVLNAQLENQKDKETITALCTEVSRFIKEGIGETTK